MKEAGVNDNGPIVADQKAAEVSKPSEGPFDNQAMAVASQSTPVVMGT
jgi:hypothetical protein